MNNELVKKLKEAGFPQDKNFLSNDFVNSVYEPTLSELIEACGSGFTHLNRESVKEWCAYDYNGYSPDEPSSTPEEAVANLWLALNEG